MCVCFKTNICNIVPILKHFGFDVAKYIAVAIKIINVSKHNV
jgi:hypothetical protein